jgi:hypothetical protein
MESVLEFTANRTYASDAFHALCVSFFALWAKNDTQKKKSTMLPQAKTTPAYVQPKGYAGAAGHTKGKQDANV